MTLRLIVLAVLLFAASPAWAQAPYPPNQFHPYRGGTNCIQYNDANGNFNCDPLVTVNTATHSISSVITSSSGGPLVVGTASSFVALGTDLVIAKKDYSAVAPTGPGAGGVTFRVRSSPRIPGYCQVVAIAGTAFGPMLEFPVAFLNPAYPFASIGNGASLFDYITLDLPGGPGGC